ncbi:MAG: peptidase M3 [Ignavibacteriae bacterium HGW-Ignavibacteriae-2]|nr:MAG: peptidase M3 [Ignavibacteriae bacterium HGW-Ignavibacteriae-2]
MVKKILMTTIIGFLLMSFTMEEKNPLLQEWNTPFGTPPFDKIKQENYLPAFKAAIEKHTAEVEAIIKNAEKPTFQNTIEELEYSGELLTRVSRVFAAMSEAMTNDELQDISKEVTPMLSKHQDDINLNPELFKRVKTVYEQKDNLKLTTEQSRLLDEYYKSFVRGGANLIDKDKEEFRKINEELSMLSLQFGENVLKETNKYELVLSTEEELAGLPETIKEMGASEAAEKGYSGKWVYTIQRPSMYPFLTYSTRRDLREKLYKAYINRGDNDDSLDNKKILSRIASLRLKKANLLGYTTHANYVLDDEMAKTPEQVYDLLNKLWTPALEVAKKERADMQKIIDNEGGNFKLQSWDWWYYADKVKKAKYDLDEEELRPYFKVENVIKGVFGLSTKLWGITFEERNDIPKYHPDVKTFEVKDKDGSHIAILYTDYFPRDSKRGGAWMDVFTKQSKKDGKFIHPIVYNVGNFAKPTGDKPSLISVDDVNTLFHEFGHALHGMLSNCTYESLSGTSTPRDFVEFPSQIMENWCMNPVVLKEYAFHYITGEPLPDELIQKINNSGKFNQGFATVEYLAASFLDMDWHTITDTTEQNASDFEKNSLSKRGMIPEIISRYRSTYFNHIFSGGYSSGYYSYIWAEVLDADAFRAFEETGDVYNQDLAGKYRKYILSAGGTEDAMKLYEQFRGKAPEIEPLLEKRGLN